ncbi:Stress protein [Zea mays]|nr:Stress protein [Zea mays]
MQPIPSQ